MKMPERIMGPINGGLRCPQCHHNNSIVIDSRPRTDGSIKRRRECTKCKNRFNTREVLEAPEVWRD